MKCARNEQTEASHQHQTAAHLADGFVELLFVPVHPSDEKAKAQAEQQIRQDGTEYRGLNDWYEVVGFAVVFRKQNHEQHDLNDTAEKGFEKDA